MTAHLRRALRLTQLLHTVNDALARAGICGLPYKGPILAQRLYGDVAMRQFSDVDIFLPLSDIPEAIAILGGIGLVPHTTFRQEEWRALADSGYELIFDGFGNQNLLEIKWGALPRFYAIDLDIGEFFDRAQTLSILDKPVLTLSDEDLLLVLCIHAAKHAWNRLSWISDIARLITFAALDWECVLKRARALGIRRILGINLFLARDLFHAKVPAAVDTLLQQDAQITAIGVRMIQNMVSDGALDPESVAYFRLLMSTRERPADRIRFLSRLVFTPSESEWAAIKLPAPLFPVYYLVRFFRLIGRALRLNRT